MEKTDILYHTLSVCPVCLKRVPARVTADETSVWLEKHCPDHGSVRTMIWAAPAAHYRAWLTDGGVDVDTLPQTEAEAAALLSASDFCASAERQPLSSAVMTTTQCDATCKICFTREAGEHYEPDVRELRSLIRNYRDLCGPDALLELCGGEPTTREDLPLIAAIAKEEGFDYIQVNSNGRRLASDPAYCKSLHDSGVTTIYLSFDGIIPDSPGMKCETITMEEKELAIANCQASGLAVVLVPCVVPGRNDDQLSAIVDFAACHAPTVRGVYYQPVSYFGRFPAKEKTRITIPEILKCLEAQTDGRLRESDFLPGAYEWPTCTFQAVYLLDDSDGFYPLTHRQKRLATAECYGVSREKTKLLWKPGPDRILFIGGMAFQDADTVDLMRLRRCSTQIVCRDGRMVPLCSKYLTSRSGERLLPGIS